MQSIQFVNSVAHIAEKLNHHPEIIIQYDKIKLSIHTHDFGGITDLDFKFIEEVDNLKIS
jgi:4a-hydroxytetrahydrobiopterin dehydratase